MRDIMGVKKIKQDHNMEVNFLFVTPKINLYGICVLQLLFLSQINDMN